MPLLYLKFLIVGKEKKNQCLGGIPLDARHLIWVDILYNYILKPICHQLSAHCHFNLSSPWPCGCIDGEIKIGGVMLGIGLGEG